MSEKLEKRLKKEIEDMTPDLLGGIISSCDKTKGEKKMNKVKKKSYYAVIAAAAAFALIFGGAFGAFMYNRSTAVDTVISIDVNPGVEIHLNKNEKVVSVDATNDDGMKILTDRQYNGLKIEDTLASIVADMTEKGYIDANKNSVLVCVKNGDQAKCEQLRERLSKCVEGCFKDAAVLSQSVSGEENVSELAKKHGISEGKALLIKEILEQNELLTADDIAKLPINDLNLIVSTNGMKLHKTNCNGTPGDKGYIGKAAAQAAALGDLGISAEDVERIKVKMDCEDGIMTYEVEFVYNGMEYEYELNALNGEIIDIDIEEDDGDDKKGNGKGEGNGKHEDDDDDKECVLPENAITEEEALNIACQKAGVASDAIVQSKVSVDEDDGVYEYDVVIKTADKKYSYEINAIDGTVISESVKAIREEGKNNENNGNNSENIPAQDNYIGKDKALAIAYEKCGIASGDVVKSNVGLDKEDGVVVYEIDLKTATEKYEISVDALTGEVVEIERKTLKEDNCKGDDEGKDEDKGNGKGEEIGKGEGVGNGAHHGNANKPADCIPEGQKPAKDTDNVIDGAPAAI